MSASKGTSREQRELIALAEDQGWEVTITGGNHLKFKAPDGQLVFTSCTPSDHRAAKNARAFLRRNGLDVPHPQPRKKKR